LDRRTLRHKITRRVVDFDPEKIILHRTEDVDLTHDNIYNLGTMSSIHYRAIAVAIHTGSSFGNQGHYYVYRRTLEGAWCKCNDSEVRVIKNASEIDFSGMTFMVLQKL
jgi:ubiquitin C-terminal hydrolase